MSPKDTRLRGLISEIAETSTDDVAAILDQLDPSQRGRAQGLLREYLGSPSDTSMLPTAMTGTVAQNEPVLDGDAMYRRLVNCSDDITRRALAHLDRTTRERLLGSWPAERRAGLSASLSEVGITAASSEMLLACVMELPVMTPMTATGSAEERTARQRGLARIASWGRRWDR